MIDEDIRSALLKQIDQLPISQQRRVLDYAASLAEPAGTKVPEDDLLSLCGSMPTEDAQEMIRVIEEECERIDPNEW